jgi:hypothetical protein
MLHIYISNICMIIHRPLSSNDQGYETAKKD